MPLKSGLLLGFYASFRWSLSPILCLQVNTVYPLSACMSACLCDCLCLPFNVISVCFSLSVGLTVFFSFCLFLMTYSTVKVIVCLAFCLSCICLSFPLTFFLTVCLPVWVCVCSFSAVELSPLILSLIWNPVESWRHHKVHRIPSPPPPPPFPGRLNTAERTVEEKGLQAMQNLFV